MIRLIVKSTSGLALFCLLTRGGPILGPIVMMKLTNSAFRSLE
jgi:hypothetical protein